MADAGPQVLIVGGGLVGASLAVALGQAGVPVALIESAPFSVERQPNYDERSIALAAGSQQIFAGLGLWEVLAADVCPIHTIHVSDRGRFGFTRLRHSEEDVPALGYVAPARVLGAALIERLARLDTVRVIAGARVEDFSVGPDRVEVLLVTDAGETTLAAPLLVAADGAQSGVRARLGIDTRSRDYHQTAVIANLSTERPHCNVAYERFTDSGPMALLPMTGGRCALVWTVPSDQTEAVMALDDGAFLRAIQDRFGYRLGAFTRVGERCAYPLQLVQATESVRPRLALIGNAVHTLHPVAGQGFNLGLRDVAALAEVLVDTLDAGGDPGASGALQRYADWRARDQRRVVTFTDGLVRLFTQPFPPVGLLRDVGMLALDLLPPAKRWFGRLAMGRAGRLPRLARGVPLR